VQLSCNQSIDQSINQSNYLQWSKQSGPLQSPLKQEQKLQCQKMTNHCAGTAGNWGKKTTEKMGLQVFPKQHTVTVTT